MKLSGIAEKGQMKTGAVALGRDHARALLRNCSGLLQRSNLRLAAGAVALGRNRSGFL